MPKIESATGDENASQLSRTSTDEAPALEPRSIQVQIVLFDNGIRVLRATLESVVVAMRYAQNAGSISAARVCLGDSSPSPVLGPTRIEDLTRWLEGYGFDFSYEFFAANLGSAGGSNRLAAKGHSDVILVLNPDTYLAPDALDELLRALRPGVGITEARQLPAEHPKTYDLLTLDTSWASGFCMMLPRDVFEAVGGFDTDHFFLYCDDVDLSWRVRLAGLRVLTVPTAIVYHDKRLNLEGRVAGSDSEAYYGLLGRLMLLRRFGRPDIAKSTIDWVEARGSEPQRRALDEWRQRESEGRVPEPVEHPERVAQFVDGHYAVHRY